MGSGPVLGLALGMRQPRPYSPRAPSLVGEADREACFAMLHHVRTVMERLAKSRGAHGQGTSTPPA